MANRNTAGFGLIAQGTLGSTPATGGQGKYYIQANYATSKFKKPTNPMNPIYSFSLMPVQKQKSSKQLN